MRIRYSSNPDRNGMGVMAFPVAARRATTADMSEQNRTMNKARGPAHWLHPHLPNLLSDGMNRTDNRIVDLKAISARS
jgi:hypothetical protein